MSDSKIQPATITKPMQLLAAWLVGLLAIDGCFLLAASRLDPQSIEASALVWAAIANVPIFLGALFLLQTRFRPELQEDLYYSTYISQRTNQTISVSRDEQRFAAVLGRLDRIETEIRDTPRTPALGNPLGPLASMVFGINKNLPDHNEISAQLLKSDIESHTWFGSDELPADRVVSISYHLTNKQQVQSIALARRLGFGRYNLFDNELEETIEDVLIGSYGPGDRVIAPDPAA